MSLRSLSAACVGVSLVVGIMPQLVSAQASPAPKKTAGPAAMTNRQVVKMVKAGLSETLIINAIRTAKKTAFDVTAEGLVALATDGVSEAIIAVMMDPSAPAATSVVSFPVAASTPAPPTAEDPMAPRDPGIYIDLGTGSPKLVALEPTVFSQGKSGGMFKTMMTAGIAKAKWKAVVRSPRANQRTVNPNQVFYFYFEQRNGGFGGAGFAGMSFVATSPNEFVLAKMARKDKDKSRELIVGQMGSFGGSSGARSEDSVEFKFEKLAPGVFRVTPTAPLAPGEYCFFHAAGGAQMGAAGMGSAAGRLFDFGVDPS